MLSGEQNRPTFDPLIVHVAAVDRVLQYAAAFPEPARRLAAALWPGPLTLLLPKQPCIPDVVTSGLPHVAIRVPAHPLARALLERLAFPLAAPSANPFGYISPTTAQHVVDQLGGRIPLVLEGGACPVGVESTIVGFGEDGSVVVHRLGGVAVEELERVLGHAVSVDVVHSSNPAAPGMLKSHYAPRKPLTLVDAEAPWAPEPGRRAAFMSLVNRAAVPAGVVCQQSLSRDGALADVAKNLFATLRALDAADVDVIYAERCPDVGLGRAINDRLLRASSRE